MLALVAIAFSHAPMALYERWGTASHVVSGVLTTSRLPLVFCLSGFFLLRKPLTEWSCYRGEIAKRWRTLAIPFFVWNAGMLLLVAMVMDRFMASSPGSAYSLRGAEWREYLDAFLGIGRKPIHYQFWFLKDLFFVSLLSPVLRWLLMRSPFLGLLVAYALEQYLAGASYFYLGGLVWKYGLDGIFSPAHPGFVWFAAVLLGFAYQKLGLDSWALKMVVSYMFLSAMAAQLLAWFPKAIRSMASVSFMIFALYEPTLTVASKVLLGSAVDMGGSSIAWIVPSVTVGICTGTGLALKRWMPGLYALLTGAR